MPKVVAPILVIVLGFVGSVALVRSKTPVEVVQPLTVDPLVRVVPVRFTRVPFTVVAQGTVLPRTETTLASQVAAQVVSVSPRFEAGGFVERGEILLRLDRRDYDLQVERATARVAQAELRRVQQQAEARVAAAEWSELGEGEPDPLVLRQPQMAEAQAMLKAAQAELGMARLALERCEIRAPFDGLVRSKAADVGQYLIPGQEVARVHAVDYAEVRLPVADHKLAFLDLPHAWDHSSSEGPAATVSAQFSGRRHTWPGQIVRTESEVDARSRMLHLVARVEDPYGRRQSGRPPLAVGLFVDAEIVGHTVTGAVLPRSALREGGKVLVVDDEERLRFREVDVIRVEKETAVIGAGLEEGERVCVSPLDVVVDGMLVRTLEEEVPPAVPGGEAEPDELRHGPALVADVANVEAAVPSAAADSATSEAVAVVMPETGRLLAVELLAGGSEPAFSVSIGGDFNFSTSTLDSPDRFVIDLLEVVKANPRSALEVVEGPVERIRIGQFQTEPGPIARLVFDLRAGGSPLVERMDDGLVVSF